MSNPVIVISFLAFTVNINPLALPLSLLILGVVYCFASEPTAVGRPVGNSVGDTDTGRCVGLFVGFGTGDEVTGEEVTGLLEGDVVGAEVTGESECLLLGDTVAARVGASDSMPPPEVEA
jgi:hypothetical protein